MEVDEVSATSAPPGSLPPPAGPPAEHHRGPRVRRGVRRRMILPHADPPGVDMRLPLGEEVVARRLPARQAEGGRDGAGGMATTPTGEGA